MGMGNAKKAAKKGKAMMRFVSLLAVLYKMKMLSPVGLYRLIVAIFQYGMNVMMLAKVAASMYGQKVAVVDVRKP